MINQMCKKYCSMNNNIKNCNSNMLETMCNNINNYQKNNSNNCECGFEEEINIFPQEPMLAQSYVPWQYMDETFKPNIGLNNGTIFPELVSPYKAGDSMKEIAYIKNTNTIKEGCNS